MRLRSQSQLLELSHPLSMLVPPHFGRSTAMIPQMHHQRRLMRRKSLLRKLRLPRRRMLMKLRLQPKRRLPKSPLRKKLKKI